MNIIKYKEDYKTDWDQFIKTAKNYHFCFQRDYMEYHKDRFEDFSLIFFNKNQKIISVLPANKKDDILYSHQGLTFGGFLVDDKMKTATMLEVFQLLVSYLKEHNIRTVIYKCMPYIYSKKPSDEALYALFKNNAKLIRRDVSSTIDLTEQVVYSKGRKWRVNKARKESMEIIESKDYKTFWDLLTLVLQSNHQVKPTHTIEEIQNLADLFPENIRLFLAQKDENVISGALIYENKNIVHTQYLANSEIGKEVGALNVLIDYLIRNVFKNKKYFDFGISNENEGKYLNTGLISQKEEFGARAVVHDFYELEIELGN